MEKEKKSSLLRVRNLARIAKNNRIFKSGFVATVIAANVLSVANVQVKAGEPASGIPQGLAEDMAVVHKKFNVSDDEKSLMPLLVNPDLSKRERGLGIAVFNGINDDLQDAKTLKDAQKIISKIENRLGRYIKKLPEENQDAAKNIFANIKDPQEGMSEGQHLANIKKQMNRIGWILNEVHVLDGGRPVGSCGLISAGRRYVLRQEAPAPDPAKTGAAALVMLAAVSSKLEK